MPNKILKILSLGPATTITLAAATGMTRQTVNRKLRALGDSVIKFDKVRPPLYYAVKEAFESGNRIHLAAVDPHGNTNLWGILRPLIHGGFFLETTSITPNVLKGDKGHGLYEGLPYFLDDMRPQGFIGRQIARELNAQSEIFPLNQKNPSTLEVLSWESPAGLVAIYPGLPQAKNLPLFLFLLQEA